MEIKAGQVWENELCGLEKRLKHTQNLELDVRRKLDIAVKALEEYGNVCNWGNSEYGYVFTKCDPLELAQQALKEIEEK